MKEFKALVGQTKEFTDNQLLSYFLAGLREELPCQMRPHDPRDLMTVMKIATDVEEALCGLGLMGWSAAKEPPFWGRSAGGAVVARTE